MTPLEADPLDRLRARTSEKWSRYPDDVLPLFVAEMDYPLFPRIAETVIDRIRNSDAGYVPGSAEVAAAFAGFARRHWDWAVDPAAVLATTDVSVVIAETLRAAIAPGDGVVIMPPVYPPFFDLTPEAGGTVVEVPLLRTDAPDAGPAAPSWAMDLAGIDAALAAGATAVLLCSPHNPLGLVHPPEQLAELAAIARRHGALVLSDEIHAPLVHADARFTPFLTVSDDAREVGIAAHAASKAFNTAGLKCALFVGEGARSRGIIAGMPEEVGFRAGKLGVETSTVAFAEGDAWLADVLAALEANRALLGRLLAAHLPDAVLHEPRASFVGWVDLRAYADSWGDDPASVLLERARVALGTGPAFGAPGRGFVRINFACSPELLEEAVRRMAAAL